MEEITDEIYRQRIMSAHAFIIHDNEQLYLIDTGLQKSARTLLKSIHAVETQTGATLQMVFLTHHHIDHSNGLNTLLHKHHNSHKIRFFAHKEELALLTHATHAVNQHTWFSKFIQPFVKLYWNPIPRTLNFHYYEHQPFQWLKTSGHTPGHLVYYYEKHAALFTGDLLLFRDKRHRIKLTPKRFNVNHKKYLESFLELYSFVKSLKKLHFVIPSHGKHFFEGTKQEFLTILKGVMSKFLKHD